LPFAASVTVAAAQPPKWKSMVLTFLDSQSGNDADRLTVSFTIDNNKATATTSGTYTTTMTVSLGSGPTYTVTDLQVDWGAILGGTCAEKRSYSDTVHVTIPVIYHENNEYWGTMQVFIDLKENSHSIGSVGNYHRGWMSC
jgi:hypothetical protein